MISPIQLEEAYKEFSQNWRKWAPDGILPVNISLLQDLGLLNFSHFEPSPSDDISHYFHVIETIDKVTLFNEQFAVWIVPKANEGSPSTLTYIALLQAGKPHLEIVFSAAGVYNSPKHILKVLQHFLSEVIDTEATISAMGKKS